MFSSLRDALQDAALPDADVVEVLALTETSGVTRYDACYRWRARRTGAALVTLDPQPQAAAP
jgi:predicted nucleic acid-binding protein